MDKGRLTTGEQDFVHLDFIKTFVIRDSQRILITNLGRYDLDEKNARQTTTPKW